MTTETKPMLHAEHLEQLIDSYGLPRLLGTLSDIAYLKAEHIQNNWQDNTLSKQWVRIGDKLAKLSTDTVI